MILLDTELSRNVQKGLDNYLTPETKIAIIIVIIIILIYLFLRNKIKSSIRNLYYKRIYKKYDKNNK